MRMGADIAYITIDTKFFDFIFFDIFGLKFVFF